MINNKIIVILGQTSTGKSDFAVEVALRLRRGQITSTSSVQAKIESEIISADSRQVYKGMNLGTGKITKKEMKGVKHHLLDITSPSKIFSVSDFQKIANKKIKEISDKNKIPIICGGTAFYIDTLINNANLPNVPPNKELRKELSNKTAEELFKMLEKLDRNRAKNIDKNNPVRLIRAIEIAKAIGKTPSFNNHNHATFSAMAENVSSEVLKIGLTLPPEILKERIRTRLLTRIKKGMIKEVKNLHEREKVSWKRLEALGLEYRYVSYFLQGKLNKVEMIEKLNTEIWHFAKRQKTWWKRDKEIIWINPLKKSDEQKAFKKIREFLK